MIGEFLLNIVFGISSGLFALLPDFTWNVDTSAFSYFLSILQVAGYMFPWHTVVSIVGLIFSIGLIRIVISVIKTVWDLLPFA